MREKREPNEIHVGIKPDVRTHRKRVRNSMNRRYLDI